jgi:D-alanyl-D-alanine carboxypeptidase
MRSFLRLLPSALLLVGCASRTSAPSVATPGARATTSTDTARTDALQARLQAVLDSLHGAGSFPGATVGIALSDGRTIALAVGLTDTARRTPMRPTDRMLAGSVGKTFVAAVALQLVQEGRLALDQPLSTYLGQEPWFARLPNAQALTVRMLMNHTSGIQRYEFKPDVTAILTREPDKTWTPEERVGFVLGDTAPFAAGAGWEYSDTNYILLGMVIERITGADLYAEIRRRVLEPLALRNTTPSDRRAIPGVVQGYAGANNPFGGTDAMLVNGRMVINPQMEWAGGGFATTSEDLARWAKALYEGRVLDSTTTAMMLDGVPARLGPNARYGLGVIIRTTAHGVTYGHSGFFPGWQTDMMYFPALRTAIAVQVNTSAPRTTGRPLSGFLTELAGVVARLQ